MPPWMEPGPVMSSSGWTWRTVNLSGTDRTLVARNRPDRAMIGFFRGSGGFQPCLLLPQPSMPTAMGFAVATSGSVWLTVFTHGPIVTAEWYSSATGFEPLGILEVFRT